MKQKLLAFAATALLGMSVASFANQAEEQASVEQAPAATMNFFDPNYWMGAMGAGTQPAAAPGELTYNAAHPSSWMQWIDPATHAQTHMTFTNPATYMQFMSPQFFMEFMKPENMMAWMNPASYQVMMNPQTMNYWMTPNAYMHAMDPAMYQQAMNPANYMAYANPETYSRLMQSATCGQEQGQQGQTWFGFGC